MQEQRFLLITILLVGLIGAPAVYSVVKDPTQTKSARKSSASKASARQPANIEKASETGRNRIQSKSVVIDFPCKDQGKVHDVDGTLLRLRGGSCISDKWEKVAVVNQANGFTGSVIFLKDNKFTTDFIDLQEGENKLEIQGVDEKGQTVSRTLTVNRRMPASEGSEE